MNSHRQAIGEARIIRKPEETFPVELYVKVGVSKRIRVARTRRSSVLTCQYVDGRAAVRCPKAGTRGTFPSSGRPPAPSRLPCARSS